MRAAATTFVLALLLAGCSGSSPPGNETDGTGADGSPSQAPTGTSQLPGTQTSAPGGVTTTPRPGTGSASPTTSVSPTASPTPTATATPTAAPNRDPTAQLTADPGTGEALLAVVLHGVGTDPDGDALSWSLDFGDGSAAASGTALPADVAHDYAAGSHTATLTVTDGRGGSAEATVAITVIPAYALAIDLSVTTGCTACITGPGASASVATDLPGLDANWVALPAAAAGHAFSVTGSDPSVAFTAACTAGQDVLQLFAQSGAESGTVPAGAGCLYVWKSGLFGATFTVSIS